MGRVAPPSFQITGLTTFCLVAMAACVPHSGTEPNTADVSGSWSFTESFADQVHGISCTDTGTYQLVQSGTAFSGTYRQSGVCHTDQGGVDNSDQGMVTKGQMIGRTLKFQAPNCSYAGALDEASLTSISGQMTCVLQDSTRRFDFAGVWKASR